MFSALQLESLRRKGGLPVVFLRTRIMFKGVTDRKIKHSNIYKSTTKKIISGLGIF